MKKILKSTALMLVCLSLTFGISCKKDSASPGNCVTNSQRVTDAAVAYSNAPTKANCEAYKNTVRDFFRSCSTFYAAAQKQALDEFLAEPCP